MTPARPCSCDRFTPGRPYAADRDCPDCWMFAHRPAVRRAWGGNPADCVAVVPSHTYEWVSTARLAQDASVLAGMLPPDVSGVAGIPRSGLIPAGVVATHLQLPLYELTEEGRLNRLGHGSRGRSLGFANGGGPIAVIDDTVYGGHAMARARAAMGRLGRAAVYAAVYHRPEAGPVVDVYVRVLPSPHLLEWNFANNGPVIGHAANPVYGRGVAFDIDGVIVHDADSGGLLGSLYLPPRTHPVPLLVTGRRERHRAVTEELLRRYGVKWQRLEMLPDDAADDPLTIAAHKARHYAASGCGFFIESCPEQAELIHHLSGRPVICPRGGRVWQAGAAPAAGPADTPGPLLPVTAVAPIFAPLAGKRVGLVHSPATGNAGDRLIERAAEQLLTRFGIDYRVCEPDDPGRAEVLLLFGGGNYGHPLCRVEAARRATALATGRPCVLLPQTAHGPEPGTYAAAFVRDTVSQRHIPGSVLAPDLALCYTPERPLPPATTRRGEFFTTSPEGLWQGRGPDPRHRFTDPRDYLDFVAGHREIVTDCLHVAVCGLIARRRVTLLPTARHEQRATWEAWLRHLGCGWADHP